MNNELFLFWQDGRENGQSKPQGFVRNDGKRSKSLEFWRKPSCGFRKLQKFHRKTMEKDGKKPNFNKFRQIICVFDAKAEVGGQRSEARRKNFAILGFFYH